MTEKPWKPSKEQLDASVDKTVADLIDYDLEVLFCGINPGLYTAAIGHHFGRPGNRFWKLLFLGGFTPRQFSPFEERELLSLDVGITNIVERTTRAAIELKKHEYLNGAQLLTKKVLKFKPRVLAMIGIQAYRIGFKRPDATVGLQDDRIGRTSIWVLPSTSGLQAHYSLEDMAAQYSELRKYSIRQGRAN